jgi:transcription elongation factor SPT6
MDDFIDDDIGDQGQILAAERRTAYDEEGGGVSEAQLNEASEIFGTEYLEFMAQDEQNVDEGEDLFGRGKYRERGVGVDLGVDSEEEELSEDDEDDDDDDDDDLFGDDDGDGVQAHQKAEALKLKRQKRELARQERRRNKKQQKNEKRKAQLRRAFEPVQLVENFCTDRDDEIRSKDAPERLFDWKTPFHGASNSGDEITEEEEEEAMWIMGRIPEIAAEYLSASRDLVEMEEREKSITSSIAHALRFLHLEKLEPPFIKRYRKDVVTSPAVRENLYNIMDEDAEWDTMVNARAKVGNLLEGITRDSQGDEVTGAEAESVKKLEQDLADANEKLEEIAQQESEIKDEIEKLGPVDDKEDDDDDDDELFGDGDDDDVSNTMLY